MKTRRFTANGRPLRLLPGGRQAGRADKDSRASSQRLAMDRDGLAAGSQNQAAAADSLAGPDSRAPGSQNQAAAQDGLAAQDSLAGPDNQADRSEGLGPVRTGALAGQGPGARCQLQLVLPHDDSDAPQQVPGHPDDHPGRYDHPGQPEQRSSHYLASAWEYAGARAAAAAGRHRQSGHPERKRANRKHTDRDHTDRKQAERKVAERTERTGLTLGELRALWAAQHLSSAGDLIAQVAIAIGVYDRTRSPFLTALAYALTYLPPVLGGRLLGRLTAKTAPRTVMIGLDLTRAGLVAAIALTGRPLPVLCLLLLAVMLLGPPFAAARTALLQNARPAERRPPGLTPGAMSWQASQALGFLLGAAAVAVLQPRRVLLIDAASFLISACLLTALVRHRRAGLQPTSAGASHSEITAAGPGVAAILRSSPVLRTLLLFGWLAGCYVVPEGLAVPYAHALGGGPLTVGLLMAAMPVGALAGIIVFTRATRPEARTQLLGWLAMLCCMPLAFCSLRPPLWVVLILWALAGAGTAYQLVVAAAVSQASQDDLRPGALRMAQSGLLAAQALGFIAAGTVAELIGPQAAVALAGLLGLTAAAALARIWDRQHDRLIWARRASATVVRDQSAAW